MKRATSAVSDHTNAQIKEEVEMAVADLKMKYYSEPQKDSFFKYLENNSPYTTSSGATIDFSEDGSIKYEDTKGLETELEIDENEIITITKKSDGTVAEDTIPPVVTLIKTTTSSISFTATDKRGVVAYAVTETNSKPTEWTEIEKAKSYTKEVTGKKSNTTYYIWAKDGAGNVSEGKEAKTIDFEAFSYETSWNGAKATITVKTPSTGVQYKIGTTSTWTSYSETSKPQVDSGTIVYFQVTDGTNTKSYSSITPLWTGTVTYDANGGTGAPSSVQAEHKSTVTVNFSNKPTRTKYNFLGWATTSNATTATYTETGTKTFTMPSSSVTLYAVWEKIEIKAENYGEYVDLGTSYVKGNALETGTATEDWRIFYKYNDDETKQDGTICKAGIYLILADYLPYSYEGIVGSGLNNADSSHPYNWQRSSRNDLINGLRKVNAWNNLISSDYVNKGITVQGAVDLETWVFSWNSKGYSKIYFDINSIGYRIAINDKPTDSDPISISSDINGYSDTLYFNHKNEINNTNRYWLASFSANNTSRAMNIKCDGRIGQYYAWGGDDASVRPCVYIPSDIELTKGSDGIWRIN